MKQYIELLKIIQEKGTHKPAARANMPGTQSLFGYQFRHNLADGFPLLTTKKISFKNVVTELLWFLRGDTNIKYLIDNNCNIWNEDAYNYYKKIACGNDAELNAIMMPVCNKMGTRNSHPIDTDGYSMYLFDEFVAVMKSLSKESLPKYQNYTLGDCGFQYGRVWREWGERNVPSGILKINDQHFSDAQRAELIKEWDKACRSSKPVIIQDRRFEVQTLTRQIDQIKTLIEGLKNNPESRRHMVTAIDPAHDQDLALYWCHAMFQFNCRPLTHEERTDYAIKNHKTFRDERGKTCKEVSIAKPMLDDRDIPKYYLDCQLYQRSADSVLGVPYNIASYALLTHIIAKICNMIPGEFVHSFGDLHIYDNHKSQVAEQLARKSKELPHLEFKDEFHYLCEELENGPILDLVTFLQELKPDMFRVANYNPEPAIKAELSTGLIK